MKKVLIGLFVLSSMATMAAEGVNIYGRVGADVISRYSKYSNKEDDEEINVKSKARVSPNIAIEITKDINPNAELGLGLGYVKHGKRDMEAFGRFEDEDGDVYDASARAKFPGYNSIPLYLTAKYKFSTDSNLKPYVKADLGYSFNKMSKKSLSADAEVTNKATGQKFSEKDGLEYEGLKVKNGLYAGIGAGLEYNNITADLSYVFTKAKITAKDEDEKIKANNGSLRLTVGYKFSF